MREALFVLVVMALAILFGAAYYLVTDGSGDCASMPWDPPVQTCGQHHPLPTRST